MSDDFAYSSVRRQTASFDRALQLMWMAFQELATISVDIKDPVILVDTLDQLLTLTSIPMRDMFSAQRGLSDGELTTRGITFKVQPPPRVAGHERFAVSDRTRQLLVEVMGGHGVSNINPLIRHALTQLMAYKRAETKS